MKRNFHFIAVFTLLGFGCTPSEKKTPVIVEEVSLGASQTSEYPTRLSEWALFETPLNELKPKEGVIPYDLNTPLFSDYAHKARFTKIPKGKVADYHPEEVMEFPEGTLLIKNFYYLHDERDPDSQKNIIETRLLIHEAEEWKAITYIWNKEQTEAHLEIAGKTLPVSWTDEKGALHNVNYSVPNQVQCKSCHELNGKQIPIGPTARQLNRSYDYPDGSQNQLVKWTKMNLLDNTPPENDWPAVPLWDDPQGTLNSRARAWLEINCAHCHRKEGPAKNSGLSLRYDETDPYKLGVMKPPVAAGRGSGGLKYGIFPGRPEESILFYRINSIDPGVMMPEVGRRLNHEEGIDLIREWIEKMDNDGTTPSP